MRMMCNDQVSPLIPVFRFNPLRHVLGALVVMVAQHAAGEVIGSELRKMLLAIVEFCDQRRTMNVLLVTTRPAVHADGLGLEPMGLVLVELHGVIGELAAPCGSRRPARALRRACLRRQSAW